MFDDYKPLFKDSGFVYLWSSQILSQLTINIMNFLLLIRIYQETGSSIATSFLWVAYALPAVIIGPLAAASIDLIEKRKLLMASNILQSLVVLLFALTHEVSFFLVYAVPFGYSLINQFYVPTELASLPIIVKDKFLAQANGLFFITQQAAIIVGFGLAGPLSSIFGFKNTFIVCSVLLFLAFVSVSFLNKMKAQKKLPKEFEKAFGSFFEEIVDGYRFLKKEKKILFPFFLLIALQVSLTVIVVNIPVIAVEIMEVALASSGTFLVVPAGIGAATSAYFTPKMLKKGMRKIEVIDKSLMVFIFAVFAMLFITSQFAGFTKLTLNIILIWGLGVSFLGMFIPTLTFLQQKTPGRMRGRVFGNFWFLVTLSTLFPVILSGTLVDLVGPGILMFLLAGFYLGILIFVKSRGYSFVSNNFSLETKNEEV